MALGGYCSTGAAATMAAFAAAGAAWTSPAAPPRSRGRLSPAPPSSHHGGVQLPPRTLSSTTTAGAARKINRCFAPSSRCGSSPLSESIATSLFSTTADRWEAAASASPPPPSARRASITALSASTTKTTTTTTTELSASPRGMQTSELRSTPLDEALELELDDLEREMHVPAREVHPPVLDLAAADATTIPALSKMDDAAVAVEGTASARPPMKLLDAASIVAGTAVGGSFLALPSVTAPVGYLPAAAGLIGAWTFLVLSAVAFVEAAGLAGELREETKRAKEGVNNNNNNGEDTTNEGGESGTSIASVVRAAFGRKLGFVGGVAFVMQMVAVTTVQVVKGAEILSQLTGIPYVAACIIPPHLAAWFAFGSQPEVVEGANTGLTAMLLGGFGALAFGTLLTGLGGGGAASASAFQRAEWGRLLPSGKATWAVPVFVKLLAFGEAVPLVVERLVRSRRPAANGDDTASINADPAVDPSNPLVRARSAILLGSSVPLLMTLLWAALSTILVDPAHPNPLGCLLSHPSPTVSIPVGLLSAGAIGTTLLGSFLAVGHFASDVLCAKLGSGDDDDANDDGEGQKSSGLSCSLNVMNLARWFTVLVPSLLACAGPGMYLPLLAFAGAYPTAILYGLVPSLAALVLRRRLVKGRDGAADAVKTPRLVPGGEATLATLAAMAAGIVGACSTLAIGALRRASAGALAGA